MNEYHGARARVVQCRLSVDEHFCDCGHDVFLYIENMFNFAEANSKVYSLTKPSVVGYQATLSIDFKDLQKRIITNYTQEGSPNTNTKKKFNYHSPTKPHTSLWAKYSSSYLCSHGFYINDMLKALWVWYFFCH
jgi:hypothetical protein